MAASIRDGLNHDQTSVGRWERFGLGPDAPNLRRRAGIRRRSPRILELVIDPARLGVILLHHRLAYAPMEDFSALEELLLLEDGPYS